MTTADILTGANEPCWDDNLIPIRDGLDILPSSSGLYDLDLHALKDGVSAPENLRVFCECAADDGYPDFMFFDCPPGYTLASVAALLAADEVIIPVTADAFSLYGVSDVLQQVHSLQAAKPGLRATVLMTSVHNADVVSAGEDMLRKLRVPMFSARIRRTDKVPESTMSLSPLAEYSPGSAAARDYRALARELLEV